MHTCQTFNISRAVRTIALVIGCLLVPHKLQAKVLYSQDFESVPVGTTTSVQIPPGLNGIGSSGQGTTTFGFELGATNGTASSHGLSLTFDAAQAISYEIHFGSGTATLAPGISPSQIRISMDLKAVGSISSSPVTIKASQIDRQYEAARHIDLNNDGDMNDSAIVFESDFPVHLVDGADFTRVSFTLNQGQLSAFMDNSDFLHPTRTIPLVPTYDPALGVDWNISVANAGFGNDAGNGLSVDNIVIDTVPEPTTSAIAAAALAGISSFTRRAKRS
jgi:hypothetical protein